MFWAATAQPDRPDANPLLQQLLERLDGEPGVPDDPAHGVGVHGVRPRDREDPSTVSHHDVLPLPGHPEPALLQDPNASKCLIPGTFGTSPSDVHFPDLYPRELILDDLEVFLDGVSNIGERVLLGLALGPATR